MELINDLPEGWKIVSLGDKQYFEILSSGIKEFKDKKMYISTKCINGNKIIDVESEITYSNRPSRANMQPVMNSVWFAKMKNTIKVYAFTEENEEEIEKYILSTGFCGIKCKDKITTKYLEQFFMSSFFNKIKDSLVTGSTQQDIKNEAIAKIPIILPTIKEREKIVDILSTMDSVIQKVDEIIAKTERLKKGLMKELLTGRIRVEEKDGKIVFRKETEFKDTEIGKIPEDWEVVKLEKVVEIWDKYRIPVKEQERKKGQFPYCGANGIIDYIDGYTHDGEFVLLAEDGGFFGPFEKSAYIMRGKFWANNHVHILKATNGLINEFLMFYLNFANLTPFLSGSTRPKLTQDDLKKIPIPLPQTNEQQRIIGILLTIDEKLEFEKKRKEKLERIKKGLMDLLLTGKVRVKV